MSYITGDPYEENYIAFCLAIISPRFLTPEEALWVIRGKRTIYNIQKRGRQPKRRKDDNKQEELQKCLL